ISRPFALACPFCRPSQRAASCRQPRSGGAKVIISAKTGSPEGVEEDALWFEACFSRDAGGPSRLQSLLIRQREQSLYNRAKAYEHHKQLQQIPEPGIGSKAVDGPKADCSNDNNDQYADQNRNDAHSAQLLMMPKISICG